MPFSKIKDPLSPDELKILQEVFDGVCQTSGVPKTGPDAEALALILVRQFQNGLRDQRVLMDVARNLIKNVD